MNVFFLVIAFVAGMAISVQAAVNGQLAAGLNGNTPVAALVAFAVGCVALGDIYPAPSPRRISIL